MKDRIELLSPDSLSNSNEYVIFTDYWCKVLNMLIGWHYILDIAWILKKIDELNLPYGATILDAGAGKGVLQFILASQGYTIYSVDFSDRKMPRNAAYIFRSTNIGPKQKFDNNYTRHLQLFSLKKRLRLISMAIHISKYLFNVEYVKELFSNKKQEYGSIKYYSADFRNMENIDDETIDCIVSVSALEHNNHKEIKDSIKEFIRILKPSGAMFITTSATNKEDWYHEQSKGWCFSEETLKVIFDSKEAESNFTDFDMIFNDIKNSNELQLRLSFFYYQSGDNGMPWGKWDPKYIPVGVTKWKNQEL